MSSSSKKTSISTFDFNIITWNLDKQCESQPDSDDNNTDIIETFISHASSHHIKIPIPTVTKDCSHWQSLLEFSCEQFKDNLIQLKLDTVINQIDDQLAANFYELMAVW